MAAGAGAASSQCDLLVTHVRRGGVGFSSGGQPEAWLSFRKCSSSHPLDHRHINE
jgi:hypothetical protein